MPKKSKKPDENIMRQKDGIEVGYFEKRKPKFNDQLQEGIDRANPQPLRKPAKRKPRPKPEVENNEEVENGDD